MLSAFAVSKLLVEKYFGNNGETAKASELIEPKLSDHSIAEDTSDSFFKKKRSKVNKLIENQQTILESLSTNKIRRILNREKPGTEMLAQRRKEPIPYETLESDENDRCSLQSQFKAEKITFGPPSTNESQRSVNESSAHSESSKRSRKKKRPSFAKPKEAANASVRRTPQRPNEANDRDRRSNGRTQQKPDNRFRLMKPSTPAKRQNERINLGELGEMDHQSKIDLKRVLVHSKQRVKPVSCIQDAYFTEEVHAAMRKQALQETYVTQAYSWYVFPLDINDFESETF